MTPAPFVGIGSGRCGTVSLARIVAACGHSLVSHENPAFRSPWTGPATKAIDEFVEVATWARANAVCFGDVALYWLPHVEELRRRVGDLRVICLKRDKAATIRSFERKIPGYTLLREQDRGHFPEWWDLFPHIEAPTVTEAWSRYYDAYYAAAEALPDVLHVRTEDLEDDRTIARIFDFLAIPAADRVYRPDRRHNTIEETVISRSRR